MQTGVFVLNWAQVAALVVSCLVVLGAFLGIIGFKRRRRRLSGERPPQREKVLRPAGHSAMCRLEEARDKLMTAVSQGLAAGVVVGLGVGAFYPLVLAVLRGQVTLVQVWAAPLIGGIIALAIVTLGALGVTVWQLLAAWRLEDEIRNWRFGLRGEQAVAEKLVTREVSSAGYIAFHDVPGDGPWNIDHVVVGPGGVFVLETKARSRRRSKRAQEEQEVIFDGRALQFPWGTDWEAVDQAERNAKWVREFLAGYGPKDLVVQPVIVVPGWYVKSTGNFAVKAMPATYLVGYLKGAKRVFTAEQLEAVVRRLDERCRVLEF